MTNYEVMESMMSHLPKVDDKALEFEVDIKDAQFNVEGNYYIQFSIQSLHTTDYSSIQLKKGTVGTFISKNEATTEVVHQTGTTSLSKFKEKLFRFRLPLGFCKNDKNHDVYLLVEAFAKSTIGKAKKVGEGKFAIYPRPNAPRFRVNVDPGDNFYSYTDVLSLLRTGSTDSVQMHCGRIRCTYSLREVLPPKPKTPPPSPVKKEPKKKKPPRSPPKIQLRRETSPPIKIPPTPDSWGDIELPPSPPLLSGVPDGKKLPESALAETDRRTFGVGANYRHVAREGKEQIEVILHGATGLPNTVKGEPPKGYGVIKSKSADVKNMAIGSSSHMSLRPTHSPSWEELLTITMVDEKDPTDDEETNLLEQLTDTIWEFRDSKNDVVKVQLSHLLGIVTPYFLRLSMTSQSPEVLVVSIGDGPTKERLVHYDIPVAYLTPFHQYHMELVTPVQDSTPGSVRTYATIIRKMPTLPLDSSSPKYLGLEVMLRSVQKPFETPLGPLIAVARIVPDYYNYKSDNLLTHPRTAGVNLVSVTFPSPHKSTFNVPVTTQHGYPQLSLTGRPDGQPTWNHPFLFCADRDKATLFTPGAALVLEYYVASTGSASSYVGFAGYSRTRDMLMEGSGRAMSEHFWKMRSPIAYSALLMDTEMYSELTKPKALQGLRIEGLPIQGVDVVDIHGGQPTVGLILRLITSNVPDTLVSVSDIENLPSVDLFPSAKSYFRTGDAGSIHRSTISLTDFDDNASVDSRLTGKVIAPTRKPGYYLQKVKKRPLSPPTLYQVHTKPGTKPIQDGEMPPHDAMENTLPDYQYVFMDPRGQKGGTSQVQPEKPRPSELLAGASGYSGPSKVPDELDKMSMNVMDHQMKELDNYRSAVQKMGQDIVVLRQQIAELETTNSQLRRDLAHYNDSSKLMIDSAELDGLTKPEIMSRYAALKQTLQSQSNELQTYKDKVQKTQNELIKKNEDEKQFYGISQHSSQQQKLLQQSQTKLQKYKKMEETCRQQEKVIEKMERLLEKQHKSKSKDKGLHDPSDVLLEENKRLRSQAEELRDQVYAKGSGGGISDSEKFELYQSLEKAEARVIALEKQLADNSRQMGKERADMQLRLNEAEHGFGRSQGMVLHDYPIYNDKYPGRNSPRRLSPLYR